MPIPLIESSPTFDDQVPVPIGGEPRTAMSVRQAFQALANRTRWLKAAIDAGATKTRLVADAAALRSLSSYENGDLAGIAGGSLYVFSASSTRTDDGRLSIKPTSVGVGAGRWLSPAVVLLDGGGTITGPLTVTGALSAGSANVTGELKAGSANVTGELTARDSTLGHIKGKSITLEVDGVPGFVSCGQLEATGQISTYGGIGIRAPSTLTAPLTPSGAGRVRRRVLLGLNADHTYSIADADVIICPDSLLTAERTYTLVSTGAADGDEIEFVNLASDNFLMVKDPSGSTVALKSLYGHWAAVRFVCLGGTWRRLPFGAMP